MRQEIVIALPPVFDRCVAAFGHEAIIGRPIVWSWGNKVFNPLGIEIPPEILAHEKVHGERQSSDPVRINAWWDKYLTDAQFRYDEELVAHRAEWHAYFRRRPGKDNTEVLNKIAERLASSLYGGCCTVAQAKDAIQDWRTV